MFFPPRINSNLLNLGLLAPLGPKSPILVPPSLQLLAQPATTSFSALNGRFLRHEMSNIIENDVAHSPSLSTAAPTNTSPRCSHFLRINLRERNIRFGPENI